MGECWYVTDGYKNREVYAASLELTPGGDLVFKDIKGDTVKAVAARTWTEVWKK